MALDEAFEKIYGPGESNDPPPEDAPPSNRNDAPAGDPTDDNPAAMPDMPTADDTADDLFADDDQGSEVFADSDDTDDVFDTDDAQADIFSETPAATPDVDPMAAFGEDSGEHSAASPVDDEDNALPDMGAEPQDDLTSMNAAADAANDADDLDDLPPMDSAGPMDDSMDDELQSIAAGADDSDTADDDTAGVEAAVDALMTQYDFDGDSSSDASSGSSAELDDADAEAQPWMGAVDPSPQDADTDDFDGWPREDDAACGTPEDGIPVAMPVNETGEEPVMVVPVMDTGHAQVSTQNPAGGPPTAGSAPSTTMHNGEEVELLPFNPMSIRRVDAFRMNRSHDAEVYPAVAEEFRVLRTNLMSLQERRGIQSVTFSSCHHGEGKTTSVTNLARFMAKSRDRRILLVDTDIRRPRVKELLNIKVEYGIDDVLSGKCSLEQAMMFSEADNLTVLPARRGHSNATELIELPLMDSLIATMAEYYDFVLYDSTPIFSTADPSVMSTKTDGLLMVVKAGMTYRESIEHAQHQIEQAGGVILGVVLNQLRVYLPRYLSRYHYYQDYYTDYYHRRRAS